MVFGYNSPAFRFISLRSMLAAIRFISQRFVVLGNGLNHPLPLLNLGGEQAESYFFLRMGFKFKTFNPKFSSEFFQSNVQLPSLFSRRGKGVVNYFPNLTTDDMLNETARPLGILLEMVKHN